MSLTAKDVVAVAAADVLNSVAERNRQRTAVKELAALNAAWHSEIPYVDAVSTDKVRELTLALLSAKGEDDEKPGTQGDSSGPNSGPDAPGTGPNNPGSGGGGSTQGNDNPLTPEPSNGGSGPSVDIPPKVDPGKGAGGNQGNTPGVGSGSPSTVLPAVPLAAPGCYLKSNWGKLLAALGIASAGLSAGLLWNSFATPSVVPPIVPPIAPPAISKPVVDPTLQWLENRGYHLPVESTLPGREPS